MYFYMTMEKINTQTAVDSAEKDSLGYYRAGIVLYVTREFLEVDGRKVPVSSLASVDLNAWSEKVTLKDEAGNQVLSTVCTGIMSHDLFLTTLDVLLDAQRASSGETVESLA